MFTQLINRKFVLFGVIFAAMILALSVQHVYALPIELVEFRP